MFLKFMGVMPGYIYAQDKTGIYVNLFVGSTARIQLAEQKVVLKQVTDYPWQEDVKFTLQPMKPSRFSLHIRIPGWCQAASSPEDLYRPAKGSEDAAASLAVNGELIRNPEISGGYATLRRRWKSGDVVQVKLPMPVQRVQANARVEADKGRVALMRGPLVYCFEATDNGGAVKNLAISPEAKFTPEHKSDLLGGVTVLTGTATAVFKTPLKSVVAVPLKVTATPYYANANRGTCPMQVWMPEAQDACSPVSQE